MQQIVLNVKEDIYASLERDFKTFVRLSNRLDSQFHTPSFEKFLQARVADNDSPLTEQAVQHLMQSSQYAWAKRALEKDFPEVVAILVNQAAEHGFYFAMSQDWTKDDLAKSARAWSTALVKQAKGDGAQIDTLAAQIKSAAVTIVEVEEKLRTPAWRLAQALPPYLHDVTIAVEHATGAAAREKLGELRCLLRLGTVYGSISKKEEQELLENLRSRRPFLFEEEVQIGCLDRFFLWLQKVFA